MLMLVRSAEELQEAEHVFADVYWSTSRTLLQRLLASEDEVDDLRLYSGYAGWSAGQLEMELAAGGWRAVCIFRTLDQQVQRVAADTSGQ